MIPLLRRIWWAIRFDDVAMARWIRGSLLLVSAAAAQVVPYGLEVVRLWTWQDWAVVLAISIPAGIAGMINLGEMNDKAAIEAKSEATK